MPAEETNDFNEASGFDSEVDNLVNSWPKPAQDNPKSPRRKKKRSAKSYFEYSPAEKIVESKPKKERKIQPRKAVVEQIEKIEQLIEEKFVPAVEKTLSLPGEQVVTSIVNVEQEDLPHVYDTTYALLIPRDPFCIYACWEIDPFAVVKMREKIGDKLERAPYTLRIFDVSYVDFNGYNANFWFDLDGLHMNSRYIDLQHDNATFCAEIGVRSEDGMFYPFTRSNFITTQRHGQSSRDELIWKETKQEKTDQATEAFVTVALKENIKKMPLHRSTWQHHPKRVSLSVEDVKSYYVKGRSLSQVLRERYLAQSGAREYILETDEGVFIVEKSTIEGFMQGEFLKHHAIGSSDELVNKDRFQKQSRLKPFPLELDMKLTVTGKTLPGAKVYFGNKQIHVRRDGTFELTFSLNDGILPLEFFAKYGECLDTRSIKTSVIRTRTTKE